MRKVSHRLCIALVALVSISCNKEASTPTIIGTWRLDSVITEVTEHTPDGIYERNVEYNPNEVYLSITEEYAMIGVKADTKCSYVYNPDIKKISFSGTLYGFNKDNISVRLGKETYSVIELTKRNLVLQGESYIMQVGVYGGYQNVYRHTFYFSKQ